MNENQQNNEQIILGPTAEEVTANGPNGPETVIIDSDVVERESAPVTTEPVIEKPVVPTVESKPAEVNAEPAQPTTTTTEVIPAPQNTMVVTTDENGVTAFKEEPVEQQLVATVSEPKEIPAVNNNETNIAPEAGLGILGLGAAAMAVHRARKSSKSR